jgi:hypothetical protein
MDSRRFDRLTRTVATSRLSRRTALLTGGKSWAAIALGAVGFATHNAHVVLAQDATPAADSNEIEVDGAYLCNQVFALCTTAPCELSTSDPSIANCRCIVEDSYAIGFKTCAERAQSGNKIVSNFSDVNVNSEFSVMTCPENAPWANCLDMPCEIDALNPALAVCQCQVVEIGPSLTWGGGCDTSTCTSVIWSAAPTNYLGLAQYEEGMQQVGQPVTLPAACPAAPSASPVATPE